MLDLDPIKVRLDLASGSTHSKWAHSDLVNNAPTDLAALVAEVERLRAAEETRVAHMWRMHEAIEAHQQALHDRARPEDLAMWKATYDEP